MHCMKCGREIEEGQVFCPKCLELMAHHPVKADLLIRLPKRRDPVARKTLPRKKAPTPEEQIARLRKRNRLLTVLLCLLLTLSLIFLSLSIDYIRSLDVQKLLGQNYSTVEAVE